MEIYNVTQYIISFFLILLISFFPESGHLGTSGIEGLGGSTVCVRDWGLQMCGCITSVVGAVAWFSLSAS